MTSASPSPSSSLTSGPAVIWFRRDLRVHDHPALTASLAHESGIVPLFVLDERLLRGRWPSPNRVWFMLESLRALAAELDRLGSRLHVRSGRPEDIVPAFVREVGATDLYLTRDHTPYGRRRDRAVAEALSAAGARLHARRGLTVHEPDEVLTTDGRPFVVFTPYRRAWEARPRRDVLPAPRRVPLPSGHGLDPGAVPDPADLGFPPPTADLAQVPEPGETAARARLDGWLSSGRVDDYAEARNIPAIGGTSRLSQDLRFGTLSALEVAERSGGDSDGRRTFVSEVCWRDFYAQVLWHHPRVVRGAFQRRYDAVPWREDPPAAAAWREGRTGYPIVDAGMRELLATGYMHNRARMIVASFLAKDLLIDWRAGERHFMEHLIDGDLASNNGGWQWAASTGTDAAPYFRIFNPVTQGSRFDPDGTYVRRWVPELRGVPAGRIHAPWEMTPGEQAASGCRIGIDYPAPIVDHREARTRALEAYGLARAEG